VIPRSSAARVSSASAAKWKYVKTDLALAHVGPLVGLGLLDLHDEVGLGPDPRRGVHQAGPGLLEQLVGQGRADARPPLDQDLVPQVIGSTFDAQFPEDQLPEIYNAITVSTTRRPDGGRST
jgi:hypothetical protein